MICVQTGDSVLELTVLAVVFSVLLAVDRTEEEMEKIGAFFTLVGDVLEMFTLQPQLFQRCRTLCRMDQAQQPNQDRTSSIRSAAI